MTENTFNEIIDWKIALHQANGNENLARNMLKMLIECLPKHEAELEKTYQAHDVEALHNEVHKLYGALCYTGTPRLKKAAKDLETLTHMKSKNQLDQLYQQLKWEIKEVLREYKENPFYNQK